jgi:dolichol-phosphate mannosyltransferase
VVTPTYDEVESLAGTVAAVLASVPRAHLLVVDDGSPDGTGQLADSLAAADPRISVLHRDAKDGLGRAYVAGFQRAIEAGYETVVQLDADGSHPADALPALLETLDSDPRLGVVLGSRWVPGGRVVDWPAPRQWLSRGGNWYARTLLGIPVRDITAGYRAWRIEALSHIPLAELDSRGYCFQIDMTRRAIAAGWNVAEVPITFTERRAGRSKMSNAIVVEAMWRVTLWGIARLFRRPRVSQADCGGFVDIRQGVPPQGGR